MLLEKYYEMWENDAHIDLSDIAGTTSAIPKLHNKYLMLLRQETLKLRKKQADLKILNTKKFQYYTKVMSPEEMEELGWEPLRQKIGLKSTAQQYMDADPQLIDMSLKVDYQQEVVKYLEGVVGMINNRGYQLSTIVQWKKFTQGDG